MSGASKRLIRPLVYLILAGVTLAAYWAVRGNGFIVLDDADYVAQNSEVSAGLTGHGVRWAFTESYSSNWHPITWLSHMLDCQVFGLNASAHHFVSVALHILNALLLLFFLSRVTGAFWASAFVAAVFALHPIHVESVVWVAERKDVLSTFFGLLCLCAYAAFVKAKGQNLNSKVSKAWYALALVFFALGLMSKPMLVTLPFLLLLLDYWPLRRVASDRWRVTSGRLILEKVPFLLLAAASSAVTVWAQNKDKAIAGLDSVPLSDRFLNILVSYPAYLEKMVWPTRLAVFYPFQKETDFGAAGLSALLLVAITAMAVKWWKTRPYFIVGWLWYIGTLVPVIGLVQVGRQAMADRYAYLPSIGFSIMLVWLVVEVWHSVRFPMPVLGAASLSILAAFAVLTAHQVKRWRDTKTLFTYTAQVTPMNYFVETILGEDLLLEKKPAEALRHFDSAIQSAAVYARAWFGKARALQTMGQREEAFSCFRRSLELDPFDAVAMDAYAVALMQEKDLKGADSLLRRVVELKPRFATAQLHLAMALYQQKDFEGAADQYSNVLRLQPDSMEARTGLGFAMLERGQLDEAASHFETVLRSCPTNSSALDGMGYSLASRNQPEAAEPYFEKAIALAPTNSFAHFHFALLLEQQKRTAEAVKEYQEAIRYDPSNPAPRNNLAWLLTTDSSASVRNGAEAVEQAQKACELTDQREPLLLGTLAAAYAEAGQFGKAVETAEKARDLAKAMGLGEVVRKNEELLGLYREGKPYREKR
jgi:tetratricopeptide (TPR) repeat protein